MRTGSPHSTEGARRSDLSSIARGGFLNVVGAVASGVLGFAVVVIVARGLGAHGAGMFFQAVALFTILMNVAELGGSVGLLRLTSRYLALGRLPDVRRTLWVAVMPVLGGGALMASLVVVLADSLSRMFFSSMTDAQPVEYLRILAPFIPFAAAYRVVLAGTRGFGTMLPFVLIENIGTSTLRPLLILPAVLLGLGGVAVAVVWAAPLPIAFAAALVAFHLLVRVGEQANGSLRARPRHYAALASEYWRFTAPRAIASTFQTTVLWLDVLLVGALASTASAGVYAAVGRLVVFATFASAAVQLALGPKIGALLANSEHDRAEHTYQVATWWLIGISWPVLLTLAVFAPFVLRIFGPHFAPGDLTLVVLSLAMLLNMSTGNVTVVLLMAGRSSWNLVNTAIALSLNIVLNLLLIPRFGIVGAAIAWGASIAADNIAALLEVVFLVKMRPFGTGYWRVILASSVCYGGLGLVVRHVFGASLPSFLLFAILATLLYLFILWRSRSVLQLDVFTDALRVRGRGREAGIQA